MSNNDLYNFNEEYDLKIERIVDLSKELIWKAWTTPEHLVHWFCPKPWSVSECEIDLRPGGIFRTTMKSPEGEEFPNVGCILEIVPNQRLVWTDVLLPGFRPAKRVQSGADLMFTGFVLLEDYQGKTKYTAIAKHKDSEDCQKHKEMGFHEGWSVVLDQLIDYMKKNY